MAEIGTANSDAGLGESITVSGPSYGASAASAAAGSILGGALGVGGSMLSGFMNSQEAQKNRDWQENMSNTAYQRAVKDMRAAGLNPMLAMMKGGASTPGGAQGTYPDASQLGEGVSNAVRLANIEMPNARAQRANMAADTDNKVAQGDQITELTNKLREEISAVRASRENTEANTRWLGLLNGKQLQMMDANINAARASAFKGRMEGLGSMYGLPKDYFFGSQWGLANRIAAAGGGDYQLQSALGWDLSDGHVVDGGQSNANGPRENPHGASGRW